MRRLARGETRRRRTNYTTSTGSTAVAAAAVVIVSALAVLNVPRRFCSALLPMAATSPRQPYVAIGPTIGGCPGLGLGRSRSIVGPTWGRLPGGGHDEEGGGDVVGKPDGPSSSAAREEVGRLLERARRIRESIPESSSGPPASSTSTSVVTSGDATSVEPTSSGDDDHDDGGVGIGYRLYVDIGRETGTWMDPTWGASGARIDFTVDVSFSPPTSPPAPDDVVRKMVKDNFGGKSSPVRALSCTADRGARLRGGFDSMGCRGGGYRIDVSRTSGTVRFYLDVDGTSEGRDSGYGDIFIPKGCLYFSIPCFGNSVRNLSRKEAPVTVRQVGWHTGWRREESRIVGLFRAVPIEEARERDGY